MQKPSFNASIGLVVKFISEDAIDAGGPTREYFRLLWQAVCKDSSIFVGPDDSRGLSHNTLALTNRIYFTVGRCISMALMYGGSAPHFFCDAMASYVLDEPLNGSHVRDIAEVDVQEKIRNVRIYVVWLKYYVMCVLYAYKY